VSLPSAKDAEVLLFDSDVPKEYADWVRRSGVVSWDIETSGLDWMRDCIATCQVYVPEGPAAIIRVREKPPLQLCSLLSDSSVNKIFHHAMFDLRFMVWHWDAIPRNVSCTKIASKVLDVRNENNHDLQSLLRHHLGISIDKSERLSDWFSPKLSQSQKLYAVNDVIYLVALLEALEKQLSSRGLLILAQECFKYIPIRVKLELMGYGDVYNY
jgi:ribonuclease D